MTLEPGTRLGAYAILAKLGEGGMGEVYRARDTNLNRDVALKILSARYTEDPERLRRFRLEAQAASGLNHPNILTIHEAGAAGGVHYIAAEFVDGETLRQMLQRTGSVPIADALKIAVQIASALAAAHQAGIVHRDVKPENVMVRRDGYVKVLDFGVAKLMERDAAPAGDDAVTAAPAGTRIGAIVGTVPYMSPEQARGEAVDPRTDVWSFGCLLYEMLSGRSPFAGTTTTVMLVAILDKEPAPLTERVPRAPVELDWIIGKMLRKNAGERYQSMADVVSDLRRLQQRLDAAAQRQPVPAREIAAPSAGRRSRVSLGIGSILVLAVAALAAVWFWRTTTAVPSAAVRSLAVLPLKSLDPGDDYLGLGIADAVIRRTSQTGDVIVRPTSAIRRYANQETDALAAARQLGADVVLEGNVQRAGDRLRVSVNLLRVSDSKSMWTDRFDMRMTDIFEIQDTVAQQIAAHLQLKLDARQQAKVSRGQTANPIAYEFYLKGLHNFDQRMTLSDAQITSTIDDFAKAIEADPNFALAHAQLAYAYATTAVFWRTTDDTLAYRASLEIERAQAIDPNLPEIALARAQLLMSRFGNFQVAEAVRVLQEARRLDPAVGLQDLGYLYAHLGLPDLAERVLQRALELDPTSEYAKAQLESAYEFSAQYDKWFEAHRRGQPNEPIDPFYFLATGRLDDARRAIDAVAVSDNFAQRRLTPGRALLAAQTGDIAAAEAAIPVILSRHAVKDPFYHHSSYVIACIYALGGKSDEAVRWLREAVATGFSPYPLFEHGPWLDRIRQAPAFAQFMTELKATTDGYHREFAAIP